MYAVLLHGLGDIVEWAQTNSVSHQLIWVVGSIMHLRPWYGICLINQTVENVYMYTVEHMYVIISWSSKYNKISSYKEVVLQTVQSLIQILLWFKGVRDHTVILSLDRTISPEGGIKIQKNNQSGWNLEEFTPRIIHRFSQNRTVFFIIWLSSNKGYFIYRHMWCQAKNGKTVLAI